MAEGRLTVSPNQSLQRSGNHKVHAPNYPTTFQFSG